MQQDDRGRFDRALRRARLAAYPPGEFVGQESFMCAAQIRSLAIEAGIGPGASVLDLCCGVAGPGRLITRELGCTYVGVDASAEAVEIARDRAGDLPCRFQVARVPPLPRGPFDVVLLLETMLAFRDKASLLDAVATALRRRGRFAFTVEEGAPLTEAERWSMPDADTVWLVPLAELLGQVEAAGLRVRSLTDCSESHLTMADSLTRAIDEDAAAIAAEIGDRALDDLLAAHRFWSDSLRDERVRKFSVVAER